jgi:hypothetical protein
MRFLRVQRRERKQRNSKSSGQDPHNHYRLAGKLSSAQSVFNPMRLSDFHRRLKARGFRLT